MAKIAVRFSKEHSREAGGDATVRPPERRQLASGEGWTVSDVVCSSGPQDPSFEEQHSQTCVGIVMSGTFQYRTSTGHDLMLPGSLLLGNAGDCFTCGHDHGIGDRCISFFYTQQFSENFKVSAGPAKSRFKSPRVAPARSLSPLVPRALELLAGADQAAFEELGILVLAQAIQAEQGVVRRPNEPEPSSLARVTRVVRMIENDSEIPRDLTSLARIARLSPYHFIRTFEGITGTTPHQYILRLRLRHAAARLREEPTKISDIALASGFGDISNFNRTFRAEFGMSPRSYRSMRSGEIRGQSLAPDLAGFH